MGNGKNNRKDETPKSSNKTVEVLYQKMGDRWFAFSLIEDEIFVGSIAQDELDLALENVPPHKTGGRGRELG